MANEDIFGRSSHINAGCEFPTLAHGCRRSRTYFGHVWTSRYSTYQYLVSGWFCLAEFAGAARVHPEESAASEAVLMQTAGRSWGTSPVAVAEDPGTQWSPMEPNGAQWTPMDPNGI